MPSPLDFRQLLTDRGLPPAIDLDELREGQRHAIEWAQHTGKPYLFINAPTGSGKTLMLGLIGVLLGQSWTYATHTIRLQEQVTRTFPTLPVVTGRANHPCLIGMETHKRPDVTAAEGICTALEWCEYSGQSATQPWQEALADKADGRMCDYYAQRRAALASYHRTANYSYILADHRTFVGSGLTDVLLCDEAHGIEDALCKAAEIRISLPVYRKYGLKPPTSNEVGAWAVWATKQLWFVPPSVGRRSAPDAARLTIRQQLENLRAVSNYDDWTLERDKYVVTLRPMWARGLTRRLLLGSQLEAPPRRAVFTSGTLVGAEYFADKLGLPDNSWAYLELPHTFDAAHRPVNYVPVMNMNAEAVASPTARARMQSAIDHLIEWYLMRGVRGGLIHSVSNNYRDYMLTESRFRAIMVSSPAEHETRIANGECSVLVAANVLEGWDGVGDLVRFTIMPKVPYANLGDQRVRRRLDTDPRSYDYNALIGVIQGAGRGTRSEEDYSDTWILDKNWQSLYNKRKSWLPNWFAEAYHHNVKLPA